MNLNKIGVQYYKGKDNPRCKDRTGEIFTDNNGCTFEIIDYKNANNCDIKYEDGTIVENRTYRHLKQGCVNNPNYPTVYGVGFLGVGKHKVNKKTDSKKYNSWCNILERSYSDKLHKKMPTYKDCTVHEEWHNFQNFAKWFEENYNPETMEGWHIDKDILIKGNTVYGPNTCCLVPNQINTLVKKAF